MHYHPSYEKYLRDKESLGILGDSLCYDGPIWEYDSPEEEALDEAEWIRKHTPIKQFYKHYDKYRHHKK